MVCCVSNKAVVGEISDGHQHKVDSSAKRTRRHESRRQILKKESLIIRGISGQQSHDTAVVGGISDGHQHKVDSSAKRTRRHESRRQRLKQESSTIRGISGQQSHDTASPRRGISSRTPFRGFPSGKQKKCRAYPPTKVPGIQDNLLKEAYASRRTNTMFKQTCATRCSIYPQVRGISHPEMTKVRGIPNSQMPRL